MYVILARSYLRRGHTLIHTGCLETRPAQKQSCCDFYVTIILLIFP